MKNKTKLLLATVLMVLFGLIAMYLIYLLGESWYIYILLSLCVGFYFIGRWHIKSTDVPKHLEDDESFDIFNDRNK